MSILSEKLMSVIIPVAGAAGLCLVTACEPPPADPAEQLPPPGEEQTEESEPTQPEQEEQEQEELDW